MSAPEPPVRIEPDTLSVRELIGMIRAELARLPKPSVDVAGALVVGGVALLVIAGALVYFPLGVALLGLALLAAGVGVMRA